MSNSPYGVACLVTKKNREAIRFLNNGVMPKKAVLKRDTYFVYPYASEEFVELLDYQDFFRRFEFTEYPNTRYLVEIKELYEGPGPLADLTDEKDTEDDEEPMDSLFNLFEKSLKELLYFLPPSKDV